MPEALAPTERRVALLLGGAGPGAPALLREACERDPGVQAEVDRCVEVLRPLLPVDPRGLVLGGGGGERVPPASAEQISTFALELAFARRLEAEGLPIAALAGYSVGEQVAACLAGVFEVDDVLALMASEARWAKLLPRGGMIAVNLPEPEAAALLRPGLWLASVETPRLCVLSGLAPVVDAAAAELRERNVGVMRLPARHPFHTPLAGELRAETVALLRRMERRAPRVPLLSSVTGAWMTDTDAASVAYWVTRRTRTLRFGDALRTLASGRAAFYVDVSDRGTLGPLLVENCPEEDPARIVSMVRVDGGAPRARGVDEVVAAWRAAAPSTLYGNP